MKNLLILSVSLFLALNVSGQKKKSVTTSNSTTTTYDWSKDTLWVRCGMKALGDSGISYPTVQLQNLKVSRVIINGKDATVITFDEPIFVGKKATCYILCADQCTGRVGCAYNNDIRVAQVTTCSYTPNFTLLLGFTWLGQVEYTGVINVTTSDNCIYRSQAFKFLPPQY
jgi:hypothetical protein